jgi:hypothetical protein
MFCYGRGGGQLGDSWLFCSHRRGSFEAVGNIVLLRERRQPARRLVALLLSSAWELWGGREHCSAVGEEAAGWETHGSAGKEAWMTREELPGQEMRQWLPNPSFALLSPLLREKMLRPSLDRSHTLCGWKRSRHFCLMAFVGKYTSSSWGGLILVG